MMVVPEVFLMLYLEVFLVTVFLVVVEVDPPNEKADFLATGLVVFLTPME